MVFVQSSDRKPLDPCHPARARQLLRSGRAAVIRHRPFTIVMRDRSSHVSVTHEHQLKIDPGSKTTGLAIVQQSTARVVWAAELTHRGEQIRDALLTRRAQRKKRRSRKTRYRPARYLNRRLGKGWLPPSLRSRITNVLTWTARLRKSCSIASLAVELVRFDTQKMEQPEMSGLDYQRGTLAGYEVREYLLEKWGRRCAYCKGEGMPLEIEHIIPRSRGGTDRVSNLTLACRTCNLAKGNQTAAEYGHPHIAAYAKQPLKDAAAVNSTRWALYRQLQPLGLPLEAGTGGRTKYNRVRLNLPKMHWIDAACVGASTPEHLRVHDIFPLPIRATGHGTRQRCRTDRYGFPIKHAPRGKRFLGFQTGDFVKAVIPKGKYTGTHIGRVSIRFRPCFVVNKIDVHPKYLRRLQRSDGYDYTFPRKESP